MSVYDVKELEEKVAVIDGELKTLQDTLGDSKTAFTDDEMVLVEGKLSEKKDLLAQIKTAKVVGQFSAESEKVSSVKILREEKLSEKDCEEAFKGWALYQSGMGDRISQSQKDAIGKCNVNLGQKVFTGQFDAWTTPVTGYTYTVQDQIISDITVARRQKSEMRQACRALPTTDGRPIPLPYIDDTSNKAADVNRYGGGFSNTNVVITQNYKLQAFKSTTATLQVPVAYMLDSVIPVRPLISSLLSSRLTAAEDDKLTNGLGTTTVLGLDKWVTATLFYPDPADTEVDWWDVLVRTKMAVPLQYHNTATCGYMFGVDTWTEILSQENSLGNPIYVPSVNEMGQKTLFGDRVFINPYLTSGQFLYGNFGEFAIIRSLPVRFYTLAEKYIEDSESVGFCAASDVDFATLDPYAFAKAEVGSGSFINCGVVLSST